MVGNKEEAAAREGAEECERGELYDGGSAEDGVLLRPNCSRLRYVSASREAGPSVREDMPPPQTHQGSRGMKFHVRVSRDMEYVM